MGVGLYLGGRYEPPTGSDMPGGGLDEIESWLEENAGEPLGNLEQATNHEGRLTLFANFHPTAEDVEFWIPEPGRVAVSAKTSTTGPGYHIYLCDLLHRMTDDGLGIAWDAPDAEGGGDETGYFHNGNADAVREEMLTWLGSMARVVLENMNEDYSGFMVGMPLGHHYPYHGPVITPLGPRGRAWFEAVAADPSRGRDFFPWWEPGITAAFYLGRALADMWTRVRWRAPLLDAEGDLLLETHLNLQRAYRLAPTLDYPWREWQEILGYIEQYFGYAEFDGGEEIVKEIERRVTGMVGGPRLGYRREPVRVDLSGGSDIEIPGAMAEEWDEKGRSWSAWDGRRTVWFSCFTRQKPDGSAASAEETLAGAAPLPEGEGLDYQREGLVGRAALTPYEEDGEAMWNLKAYAAVAGNLALCNVFFHNLADRDWAVATWHSLNHH
jgi:hypothetical protein